MSVGPWVQDPDYEIVTTATTSGRWSALSGAGIATDPVYAGQYEWGPGEWVTTPEWRQPEAVIDGAASPGGEPAAARVTFSYSGGLPPTQVTRSITESAASPFLVAPPDSFQASYWPPSSPSGVIGFEWEAGDESVVVSAKVSGASSAMTARNSDLTGPPSQVGGGWTSALMSIHPDGARGLAYADGTVLGALSDGPDWPAWPPALGADFAIPSGDVGPEGVVLYTLTHTVPDPLHATVAPSVLFRDFWWEAGTLFWTAAVAWTVRPPRYRWIFDTAPVRRCYPRDDSLAGGAPRTYPPSRGLQAGMRTSGGYL